MNDPLLKMSAMEFNFTAFFRSGTVSPCARRIPGRKRTDNRLIVITFFMLNFYKLALILYNNYDSVVSYI
jgi:hypothetical protein